MDSIEDMYDGLFSTDEARRVVAEMQIQGRLMMILAPLRGVYGTQICWEAGVPEIRVSVAWWRSLWRWGLHDKVFDVTHPLGISRVRFV